MNDVELAAEAERHECVACRNEQHEKCDGDAWCFAAGKPVVCDCWVDDHE